MNRPGASKNGFWHSLSDLAAGCSAADAQLADPLQAMSDFISNQCIHECLAAGRPAANVQPAGPELDAALQQMCHEVEYYYHNTDGVSRHWSAHEPWRAREEILRELAWDASKLTAVNAAIRSRLLTAACRLAELRMVRQLLKIGTLPESTTNSSELLLHLVEEFTFQEDLAETVSVMVEHMPELLDISGDILFQVLAAAVKQLNLPLLNVWKDFPAAPEAAGMTNSYGQGLVVLALTSPTTVLGARGLLAVCATSSSSCQFWRDETVAAAALQVRVLEVVSGLPGITEADRTAAAQGAALIVQGNSLCTYYGYGNRFSAVAATMLVLKTQSNTLHNISLHPLDSQLTAEYLGTKWAADVADADGCLAAVTAEKRACQDLLVFLGVQQKQLERQLSPSRYQELLLLLQRAQGRAGNAARIAAAAVPQGLQMGRQLCQQWLQMGLSAWCSAVARVAEIKAKKKRERRCSEIT